MTMTTRRTIKRLYYSIVAYLVIWFIHLKKSKARELWLSAMLSEEGKTSLSLSIPNEKYSNKMNETTSLLSLEMKVAFQMMINIL